MSKRCMRILLTVLPVLSLSACGNSAGLEESTVSEEPTASEESSNVSEEDVDATSGATQSKQTAKPETDTEQSLDTNGKDVPEMDRTVLVVYFSCTGTTRSLAELASEILDADLYEITPETPYLETDLNYSDSSSRATTEQNTPDARPEISGTVENMEQYDTVLLAYPIWWGQAPRIINTFLESYDFSGKTIVPFCTSHSSGLGSSAKELQISCSDTTEWLDGRRFDAETPKSELEDWVSSIGIYQ